MKNLISILFLITLVSCANNEQQYKEDVKHFLHKAGRQNAKNTMSIIGSKDGYGNSKYFNVEKQIELSDSMKYIDSLYLVLSKPPKGYENAYITLQKIYRDIKSGEKLILIVYQSSNEYNKEQYLSHLDEAVKYTTNFDIYLQDLQVDYPQIFVEGSH